MERIHADLTLRNPVKSSLAPVTARALVDTGASLMCLPEHVATQLGLRAVEHRELTTADGASHTCPYVGPIELRFKNRVAYVGAMVLGDEVLLGAIPMQDLDVVICPEEETIDVNPDSPNFARALAK